MTDTPHDFALVLGGGGATGNAWMIGVIAGLAEAGFDLTDIADQVIGTSAGATTAAQVRSGIAPADLLTAALTPPPGGGRPPRPASTNGQAASGGERPAFIPMETVFDRMRSLGAAASSAADLSRAMGEFGLESDAVLRPALAQRRALVASRLPSPDWPERPMLVVTVDAHTGEVVAFGRDSGADLADAVTASTALPGMVATVPILGGDYVDGGVWSADNADLAAGYANVLVISPLSGGHRPHPGQFEGLRRPPEWGADLGSEVARLRARGSRVEVITPDAASWGAMSADITNLAARIPAAHAGHDQGRREADRVRGLRDPSRRSGRGVAMIGVSTHRRR